MQTEAFLGVRRLLMTGSLSRVWPYACLMGCKTGLRSVRPLLEVGMLRVQILLGRAFDLFGGQVEASRLLSDTTRVF